MYKPRMFVAIGLTLALAACNQEEETKQAEEPTEQTTDTEQSNGEEQADRSTLATNEFFEPFNGNIDHVHGIGYVANQNVAFFASHDGLKAYENGNWLKTRKENNDYMGFNATDDGFYSSGHPGSESKLPNPIGIMKSVDNGQSLKSLGFEGEVDFHLMAVGYTNHVIFAMSPHKNSVMKAETFYISEDDGESWKEVAAKGLKGQLIGLAVHPSNKNVLAAAGEDGIYLSTDQGESFELLTSAKQGTSVYFSEDSLLYGVYDGEPTFISRALDDGGEEEISLPDLKEDAVMYAAVNPQNEHELTFVSFNGDIYQTKDHAATWDRLAESGSIK